MKKLLLILLPVLALAGIGGGVWWKYGRKPNPVAHAQMLVDKGDLQGAAMELGSIVGLTPQNATAHFRLAQIELRLNDPVAAEKELKQARELGFDSRTANALLAQAYMAQSKYKELLREFSPQGLPPDQASSLLILRSAALLATADAAAAQTEAAEAERLMPQSVEAQLNSARIALKLQDLEGADAKVKRALAINPGSEEALLLKGQLQNLRGDHLGAIHTFGEAIAAAPNLVAARLERASVLVDSNENAKAREDVEAVLKIAPTNALAVYLKGVLLVRAEDYAAADVELAKLGSSISWFPRGYYFLALVKYRLGQDQQAADAASHSLASSPNDPDSIKLAASIEMAGRRYASAIQFLSKAMDLGVADADVLDLLGQAYLRNGQLPPAVQTLKRAAALAPDNAAILTRLASVRLATGDATGATSDLEHALKIAPARTDAAEALVTAALASGDIEKAMLALAQVKKQEGDSEAVGNLAGMVKMAQVDLDGATAVLTDTLKRFPQSVPTRINLARMLVVQNKPKDAERLLNEVLKREPANTAALNALLPILQAEGETQHAMALAGAAHSAEPMNPVITAALAGLMVQTNSAKEALDLVNANLKERSTNTELLALRARLQLIMGQSDAARESYRQILDLEPDNLAVRRNFVDLLLSANNTDAAKTLVDEGLRARPGDADLLHSYLEITLRAQGLDATLAAADRLAADPANRPAGRLLKGDVYARAGRFADAIAAYAAEQQSEPSSALALRIAAARSAAGQRDQAALGLREWLATNPTDADAAKMLAALDLAAHRFRDVEADLQVVLNKRPNDPVALNNLAWFYQHRNDARARSTAQKAYMMSPTPQIADTLGWILTTDGDAAKGLALLRQAAAQLSDRPTIQYHLAVALKDTGHPEDALAVLRPIVQGSTSFDEKQDAAHLLDELTKAAATAAATPNRAVTPGPDMSALRGPPR
jgi:putative PEP-CTERM system TPR-repeat lipoprotein